MRAIRNECPATLKDGGIDAQWSSHFATGFSEAGKPDLAEVTVELAPGTPKTAVHLVKRGTTQV